MSCDFVCSTSYPLCFSYVQGFSGEALTVILCCVCFSALLLLHHFFGKMGVVSYIILGTTAANIQVLKTAVLQCTSEPMVLGTVIFTSLFWATALLAENYGARTAQVAVHLAFVTSLLFLIWMGIAIAYTPSGGESNGEVQRALEVLFLPAPALLIASLVAFLISQKSEIWILLALKSGMRDRFLGVRGVVATLVAGFLDNALFSVLAWRVFAIQKISLGTLFWSYIIGSYGLRVLVSMGTAPLLHLVRQRERRKGSVRPHA